GGLLRRLAADGLAVCLVEHDMTLVMDVCETIQVLDYGRTIAVGRPEVVRADPAVIEAYLGTPEGVPL
ncbi:MAG TPA: ABC transporter ATP-binding protein, partial [Acidimicrobiales bacterium]|nr:ABC transporter ATP-binding protein [Acidimicrobiales bacterium]